MRNRIVGSVAAAALAAGLAIPSVTWGAGAAAAPTTRKQVTDDFIEALTVVEEHYAGEVDYDRFSKGAIFGMLHVLDPHSNFFDREEFETFRTEQQSQYFGIGATIAQRGEKVYILAPFANTPADKAGLRYGDEIVEIDGQSTKGWPSNKVSETMRGPRGTKVNIRVSRPGTAAPILVSIVRDAVPLPTVVNAYMITPETGYIQFLRGFNFTSAKEVEEALTSLRAQGMKSVILDLRDNPGGLVQQAIAISSNFLKKGQNVLSIRGRSGPMQNREYASTNESPDTEPLVVLVNANSASASEIVAGALQDHDRALVVGETSFGKGLVQSPFDLEKEGGGLILTTGKYYTPSGRLIQRDYSNTSIYDYYLKRGEAPTRENEKVFQTDTGRSLYGGGGITPDVPVKFTTDTNRKLRKWLDPLFLFTREAINGQTKGLESYRLDKLAANHRLRPDELPVNDQVLAAFKRFLAAHPDLKLTAADVDADREFLSLRLRNEFATAHYGIETALQVTATVDPQLKRAIAEVPQAQRMAETFRKQSPAGTRAAAALPSAR